MKTIPVSREYVFPGTQAFIVGWGSNTYTINSKLQELPLIILANEKCNISDNYIISETEMCAISPLDGYPYYVSEPLKYVIRFHRHSHMKFNISVYYLWKNTFLYKI